MIYGQRETAIVRPVKHRNCTCQAKTVADCCLTPHAALLVRLSGTIWTVMDLQGQKNAACESRPGYL